MNVLDLKKDDRIKLTAISYISEEPRYAKVLEKPKGIRVYIEVEEQDGYFGDVGSAYIWEVLSRINPDNTEEIIHLDELQCKKRDETIEVLKNMGLRYE
tara:strand:- start:360 stop:656 length:297 start_codon:yes stop_codon:yes gene_type:complete